MPDRMVPAAAELLKVLSGASPRLLNLLEQYHRIAARVDVGRLRHMPPAHSRTWELDDLLGQLKDHGGQSLLMGMYSTDGLHYVMEEYGIRRKLQGMGYASMDVSLNVDDPSRQVFRMDGRTRGGQVHRIVEIIAREDRINLRQYLPEIEHIPGAPEVLDVLVLQWMLLQDPLKSFTAEKPRLPSQEHPGLGLGMEMVGLLVILAERLGKDGLMTSPRHFSNAAIYRRAFRFLKPEVEGEFQAILRHTSAHSLAVTAWGIEKGFLIDNSTGRPYKWHGEPMLLPLNTAAKMHFELPAYTERVARASKEWEFSATWVEGQFQDLLVPRG